MSNRKRRDERVARAAQMRRERALAEARRARLITGSIVAAVIAVVVAVGVAIGYNQRDQAAVAPSGASSNYGFIYSAAAIGDNAANAGSPVRLVFYEDFQCPVCKAWEDEVGGYIDQQVKQNTVSVDYRPIAILDDASTTNYSTRAASAAACVFNDSGAEAFHTFHDLLYHNQPPEGSDGLPDSEMTKLAEQAGATGVASCINGHNYADWVANATDQASQDNITGTPTIFVDRQQLTGTNGGVPTLQTSKMLSPPPVNLRKQGRAAAPFVLTAV